MYPPRRTHGGFPRGAALRGHADRPGAGAPLGLLGRRKGAGAGRRRRSVSDRRDASGRVGVGSRAAPAAPPNRPRPAWRRSPRQSARAANPARSLDQCALPKCDRDRVPGQGVPSALDTRMAMVAVQRRPTYHRGLHGDPDRCPARPTCRATSAHRRRDRDRDRRGAGRRRVAHRGRRPARMAQRPGRGRGPRDPVEIGEDPDRQGWSAHRSGSTGCTPS